MTSKDNLKRARHPMPADILKALEARHLTKAYKDRPDYQQNDYLGWINQAKTPETREKRMKQMLEELEQGGVYMNMDHAPSRKT